MVRIRPVAMLTITVLLAAGCGGPNSTRPPVSPTPIPGPTASPGTGPTPTPAPTAEPTPSVTPTEAVPEPVLAVEITEVPKGLHPGDRAAVTAHTRRGVPCKLSYQYWKSGASSTSPPPKTRLGTKTANAEGDVLWRWTLDPPERDDYVSVNVECSEGALAASAGVGIWIWPAGFEPSATLPAELLGTWVLQWETQVPTGCHDCSDVTFVIGPCSLGTQCGSLIMARQPACRFPLVFARNSAPGDFVLDAGGDDSAGCVEGWGQGLHFMPTAEGTVVLSASDLGDVVLHRVESASTPSATP